MSKTLLNRRLSGLTKITDPEGNVKYEAAVTKDGKGMDLMFDENGKPLTKILKESDKDDDEEKED